MDAWREAFSGIDDAKLKLKAMPGDKLPEFNDPRIEVCQEFIQPHRLLEWYRSLTAFVSTSRCEGWNLMAHEAMACGVPVITHLNGGHSEYMTRENTFSAWAKLSRHDLEDKSFGFDWEIDTHEVSDAMRFVYSDPDEALNRGSIASWVRDKTWSKTAESMLGVIGE
jgi:glycosyltransferase involved in cell wall biosynthesis